tara:strand:+ start:263 stop:577 length:315 start_codon:yes stop_codon:yes gene_type:complete
MTTTIFGWIATGLSAIYRIPQIVKLLQIKKSGDISIKSTVIQLTSYLLYIAHGIEIKDNPTLVMGGISLVQNIFILVLCLKYKEEKNDNVTIEIPELNKKNSNL